MTAADQPRGAPAAGSSRARFLGVPVEGKIDAHSDGMLQFAALAGIYSLSLITVVEAAMPAVLAAPATRPSRREWLALTAHL